MIDMLIWVLILCIVAGLIIWVVRQLPLPEPFGNIAVVVVCVIVLVMLLSVLLGGLPGMRFR
jgi:hypothetical protein